MPQSLSKIYVHLVFSTKHRDPCLPREVQNDLHSYVAGTLKGVGCVPIEINSEPDHVHALFLLGRTTSISDTIGTLKKSSNDWLRTRVPKLGDFHWQAGYGAFSIGQSGAEEVRRYIRNQQEHHKRVSFEDEYRAFLRRYQMAYDEKYVWD